MEQITPAAVAARCDIPQLADAWSDLSTAEEGAPLDVVVLGCPHFSFDEFRRLARLLKSQEATAVHPRVRFFVISSQTSYGLLGRSDLRSVFE